MRPLLLVHVMPWFLAPPVEPARGWHWTMNKAPEGEFASHFTPKLGSYDSMDPATLECHLLWIKAAGFDGVLANWYGLDDVRDYAAIHRRTLALFEKATEFGLHIGIVYEDRTLGQAVEQKRFSADEVPARAEQLGRWLRETSLLKKNWVKLGGKPAVLVFGPQYLEESAWNRFRTGTGPISLLTLHHRRVGADGVFDWPVPSQGHAWQDSFAKRGEGIRVANAYPRFRDWYEEGGQKGYPDLSERYAETLEGAFKQKPDAIQVSTWNDWQEGTQIEPSKEVGYRDLETTQRFRRQLDPGFGFGAADLDLPFRLWQRRRAGGDAKKLDKAATAFAQGDTARARALID